MKNMHVKLYHFFVRCIMELGLELDINLFTQSTDWKTEEDFCWFWVGQTIIWSCLKNNWVLRTTNKLDKNMKIFHGYFWRHFFVMTEFAKKLQYFLGYEPHIVIHMGYQTANVHRKQMKFEGDSLLHGSNNPWNMVDKCALMCAAWATWMQQNIF